MTGETKRCTKCGEEKAATAEHFQPRGATLRGICRLCRLAQGFEQIGGHAQAGAKKCRICGESKPATPVFFKSSYRYVSNYCLDCHSKRENEKISGRRLCLGCNESFPNTDEYFRITKLGDKIKTNSKCRRCVSSEKKERYKTNIDKIRNYYRRYKTEKADQIKISSSLSRQRRKLVDPDYERRYRQKYRSKIRARAYVAYWKDPEKYRASARDWGKNNPDKVAAASQNRRSRIREVGGEITYQDIRRLYLSQKGCCKYCGVKIGGRRNKATTHVDHVIPISRGGANTPENIVLACQTCNLSKGPKLLHEWQPERFPTP